MEPRHVALRKGRPGIERLEPRVVPSSFFRIYYDSTVDPAQGQGGEDVLVSDNASLQPASAVGSHEVSGAVVKIN